jgi:hypothetical protein
MLEWQGSQCASQCGPAPEKSEAVFVFQEKESSENPTPI